MSWRPCWRYNTKEYFISSIVGSSRRGWLALCATSREIDCKPRIANDIVMKYTVGYNIRHFIFPKKGTEITPLFSMPTATRSDDDIARLMSVSQYREQTVGSLCSAMCCYMFMQIYAVYWLRPASSAFSLARTSN